MEDHEIISECGDDAAKWAKAFCQKFPNNDEGTMIGWFANAIETACDTRGARQLEIAQQQALQRPAGKQI